MTKQMEDMERPNSRRSNGQKFVIGVDIGTTNIRSYVYDSEARAISKAQREIQLLYLDKTKVEIDPESLWESFQEVVKESLKFARVSPLSVTGLGISTLRGTFITWDRQTGAPLHNFITWKDKRADKLCEKWNSSLKMKMMRNGAFLMYMFTGNERYSAASMLTLTSALAIMRLLWVLENIPQVREKCLRNEVLFGTIDTWLVWKLTGGQVHATDSSNACVTGLYDPFEMEWSSMALNMFHIPASILPLVKYTSDSFGHTLPEIFGSSIAINSVVGDQQASTFGQGCFRIGDMNCTLGTGTFLNINTGSSPYASISGAFPSVGWTIDGKTTYLLECGTSDTGTIIAWGQNLGFYAQPEESSQVAISAKDSGGVYFLPAYNKLKGLVPSFNCMCAFVGLQPHTTKAQLVRSILEALCYQFFSFFKAVASKAPFTIRRLSISGGVSNNDFVAQLIANLVEMPVTRSKHYDSSSLGAAFLAGLNSGMWKNAEDLLTFSKEEEQFHPEFEETEKYRSLMSNWEKASSCCSKLN